MAIACCSVSTSQNPADGFGLSIGVASTFTRFPALENLKSRVADFALAAREGDSRATAWAADSIRISSDGARLYLSHKRWLLELDGPLFDLPFAALVVGDGERHSRAKNKPIYLARGRPCR